LEDFEKTVLLIDLIFQNYIYFPVLQALFSIPTYLRVAFVVEAL